MPLATFSPAFQPIAERHESINLRNDAVLLGEGREGEGKNGEVSTINRRISLAALALPNTCN